MAVLVVGASTTSALPPFSGTLTFRPWEAALTTDEDNFGQLLGQGRETSDRGSRVLIEDTKIDLREKSLDPSTAILEALPIRPKFVLSHVMLAIV